MEYNHHIKPGHETRYASREKSYEQTHPTVQQYIEPSNTTLSTFGKSDAYSEHYQ